MGPFIAALVAVVACASPTLPLPPPDVPTMLHGPDADHIELIGACGTAEPSATIVVINLNAPNDLAVSGAIADANCGSWDVPSVYAHNGDVINVTQQFGSAVSSQLTLRVRVP
jgi:hypothetical protein